MTYRKLLNKLISESGLTIKEIVAKCKDLGESITPNYLSVLKNQDGKIASDNLSLAIAKACNSKYDQILIVQGYLDRAPQIILDYLNHIFHEGLAASSAVLDLAADSMPAELRSSLIDDGRKMINETFLAEFICQTANEKFTMDLKGIMEQSKATKPLKWVLIPISDEKDIKVLSNEEIPNL